MVPTGCSLLTWVKFHPPRAKEQAKVKVQQGCSPSSMSGRFQLSRVKVQARVELKFIPFSNSFNNSKLREWREKNS